MEGALDDLVKNTLLVVGALWPPPSTAQFDVPPNLPYTSAQMNSFEQ